MLIGLRPVKRREDGVGTKGFDDELGAENASAIENEDEDEDEDEEQREMKTKKKEVEKKGLAHLQVLLRRCWIDSVGQSCCGSQCKTGT